MIKVVTTERGADITGIIPVGTEMIIEERAFSSKWMKKIGAVEQSAAPVPVETPVEQPPQEKKPMSPQVAKMQAARMAKLAAKRAAQTGA